MAGICFSGRKELHYLGGGPAALGEGEVGGVGPGARGLLAASVGLLPRRFATHQMGWVVTEIGILLIALHFVRCTGDITYVYNIYSLYRLKYTLVLLCVSIFHCT